MISLLGFNVNDFIFLHEFSTLLELVISGVFEDLRILLHVLLAVELETKVLEQKNTRFLHFATMKDETLMNCFSCKVTLPGRS